MKNNQYKISKRTQQLLMAVGILFGTVAILDVVIGKLLEHYYHQQQYGPEFRTKYSIENTHEAMLIFGSSRAEWLYDPHIFESELNNNCYNVGRNGQSIFYHYAVLQGVLNRYKPSEIILSVDVLGLSKFEGAYDRIAVLIPYYKTHPEIRPIIALKGQLEKVKMISHIYPYNSLLLPILSGNSNRHLDDGYYHGFKPHNKKMKGAPQQININNLQQIDSTKAEYFEKFITDCIHSGIKITLVCPPYCARYSCIDASVIFAKKMATKFKIPFYDFWEDSFFINSPHLFSDYKHLNSEGVEIFNRRIAYMMKNK